jgi:hypothetical protein
MNKNTQYIYLVESKTDDTRYVCYGNPKDICSRTMFLYSILNSDDDYRYKVRTPFGCRQNISNGVKYNSQKYRVVHQIARD